MELFNWVEILQEVITKLAPILITMVLTPAIILLGGLLNTLIKKIKNDLVRNLVFSAVGFVEKTVADLKGQHKFKAAFERASKLLAKYHIKVDAEELETVIEDAVQKLSKESGKDLKN